MSAIGERHRQESARSGRLVVVAIGFYAAVKAIELNKRHNATTATAGRRLSWLTLLWTVYGS